MLAANFSARKVIFYAKFYSAMVSGAHEEGGAIN